MTLALHSSVEFRDMDIPGRRLVVARVRPEGEGTSWFLSVFDEDVTCALATFSLSLEDGEKLREAMAPAAHEPERSEHHENCVASRVTGARCTCNYGTRAPFVVDEVQATLDACNRAIIAGALLRETEPSK